MAKHTYYFTEKEISTDAIQAILQEKMGDKISFKTKKGGTGIIGKTIKGTSNDSITVEKNGYHRTVITLATNKNTDGGFETGISFSEDTLSGWLNFVHSNFGVIGAGILRLIYGNGGDFYPQVKEILKTHFDVQEKEINTGIGQLFKKNRE